MSYLCGYLQNCCIKSCNKGFALQLWFCSLKLSKNLKFQCRTFWYDEPRTWFAICLVICDGKSCQVAFIPPSSSGIYQCESQLLSAIMEVFTHCKVGKLPCVMGPWTFLSQGLNYRNCKKDFALHMWCDQAKSVWSRSYSIFSFLLDCNKHL